MLADYLPILLFIVIGIGFGVMPILAGFVLGPQRPDAENITPTPRSTKTITIINYNTNLRTF
jgi:NADH:ubiquinone oxidoreductase subunit 3 (subunit A)